MPEVKKLWIVHDYKGNDLFTDPAYQDDNHRLLHFCGALDEGGYSMDKFLRIFSGTGWQNWDAEHSKVYDDEASARKDAEKRFAKYRAKYEKKTKAAAEDLVVASKVVSRFQRITGE